MKFIICLVDFKSQECAFDFDISSLIGEVQARPRLIFRIHLLSSQVNLEHEYFVSKTFGVKVKVFKLKIMTTIKLKSKFGQLQKALKETN